VTRLALAIPAAVILTASATLTVTGRELHRASQPHIVTTTATTDDLKPLLDTSIAAAQQAEATCKAQP
jgi:hypothetical protein